MAPQTEQTPPPRPNGLRSARVLIISLTATIVVLALIVVAVTISRSLVTTQLLETDGRVNVLVSSVLDHARAGYDSWWLLIPPVVGSFGMVTAVVMGALDEPSRLDVWTYIAAMLLLVLLGPLGTLLHVESNLVGRYTIVIERFIRGAPFLAPLLYTNMGLLGLIALLDPRERTHEQ